MAINTPFSNLIYLSNINMFYKDASIHTKNCVLTIIYAPTTSPSGCFGDAQLSCFEELLVRSCCVELELPSSLIVLSKR